ncbi:acetoin utilization protein AcuC [Rhodovibrio sodomensis]|uniref:Acetoin utilization protein AcuC n=1 Tax=Rhodovibrio sodomensis TaxID=1088 RepID=A0ABS1DD74_9PROT|nr:acetoin utilization protein AcuC [Rhodovibrio sodomensis]MBK1668072.1 acetoin utilization protein AcuC [Rhodovibrio sodomensis]
MTAMHDASPLQPVAPKPAGQEAAAPRFIGSEIYRHSSYGAKHPLSIPRVSTCIDLCRAMGWLPDAVYHESPRATPAQLARFHDPGYIAAVQAAELTQRASEDVRVRHDLGARGNPVFPEVFRRPATAAGGSILAARMLLAGAGKVHNPAGGTHHGRPDRASGFCYFNDPVLALLTLLDGGLTRVLYLDTDAHHADGVQDALHGDPRVLMISVHEDGRWPMAATADGRVAGSAGDTAGGSARNIPVPPDFNDDEMAFVLEAAILPLIDGFEPEAIVIQGGSDACADDPLSRLGLSNAALWRVVRSVMDLAPRTLMLGGGGYNPWSVGRTWAGFWAVLNGYPIPDRVTPAAEAVLRGLSWRHSRGRNPPESWFTALADPPRRGPLRQAVRDAVATALAA